MLEIRQNFNYFSLLKGVVDLFPLYVVVVAYLGMVLFQTRSMVTEKFLSPQKFHTNFKKSGWFWSLFQKWGWQNTHITPSPGHACHAQVWYRVICSLHTLHSMLEQDFILQFFAIFSTKIISSETFHAKMHLTMTVNQKHSNFLPHGHCDDLLH